MALRRPSQASISLPYCIRRQADEGRLDHFKNCLWHGCCGEHTLHQNQPVLAAIHTMNQPLKGKTDAVMMLLHRGMSCPRRGFLERFDDFAAHLPSEKFT